MDIPRIRQNTIRLKKLFRGEKATEAEGQEESLCLPYRRSNDEEYTFKDGHILLNGTDLEGLIDDPEKDIGFWIGLSSALDEYRRTVWSRYGVQHRGFNGKMQSLLDKLLNKLTHAYEEMTGGIRVLMQGGRLWINDIDPKVVLALFMSNPTEERRLYLESIRNKLALILAGKVGKSSNHAIVEEARRIHFQIQGALENQPSHSSVPLLPAVGDLGR
ncbi:MAG: hypothetical protein Q7T03_07635 [Deltaproteobacteria bacterium]|nr:hypothetical protein [Deltaproteobacteria bacterium]